MKARGINPAALWALLNGDLENFHVAMTPGGIEQQEAIGQQRLVASEMLPRQCGYDTSREQMEAMGIVFGEIIDDLFVEVRLPEGWKKIPTDHPMWSCLVDDKGRKRAAIFYKAAFYDRKACIYIEQRFAYETQPIGGWESGNLEIHCVVFDCGNIIWSSTETVKEPRQLDGECTENFRCRRKAFFDKLDELEILGRRWLEAHYPDWENPLAYWD